MKIFSVDYDVLDAEKYKANPKQVPRFVLSDDFMSAVITAKEYEDDNLKLSKCDFFAIGNVAVASPAASPAPTKPKAKKKGA